MTATVRRIPTVTCSVTTTRQRGDLKHVTKRIRANSRNACKRWAQVTKAQARKKAAVDTGYMKANVKIKRHGPMSYEVYVDGLVTTEQGAFYAVYVEYGTRYMRAQPFFWPAVTTGHGAMMALMVRVYRKRGI